MLYAVCGCRTLWTSADWLKPLLNRPGPNSYPLCRTVLIPLSPASCGERRRSGRGFPRKESAAHSGGALSRAIAYAGIRFIKDGALSSALHTAATTTAETTASGMPAA